MKDYILKNIPEQDHKKFKTKAKLEGKSIRTKLLEMIKNYIGRVNNE